MFPKTREIEKDTLILRQGEVDNDEDGTPLLINFKGEAYRVNDTAVSLWNMCNGISFQDLLHEVLRISNDNETNVRRSLLEMLLQLNDVSVIKLKKVKFNTAVSR
jgi:hypothetical protein